jgi:thiamine kinase-like enzyme
MIEMSHATIPDLTTLAARLSAALDGEFALMGPLTVIERQPSLYASTFPSEVVTCRQADGSLLRVFCKYSAGLHHGAHGHRGGPAYEAIVYKRVLQPLAISAPRFYGAYHDGAEHGDAILIEFLDQCRWVDKALEPDAMSLAASWIGRFHALNESRAKTGEPDSPPLTVYNREYYRGWARRTSKFALRWHGQYSWLARLCERFEETIAPLLSAVPTVIHGEFYPTNILYRGGTVYPVDWESAAIGAGEIDLATLTEDWPEQLARQCEVRYQQERWPAGPPVIFRQTLQAARLYLFFRWLGDRPEWTDHDSAQSSIERLGSLGERMGII